MHELGFVLDLTDGCWQKGDFLTMQQETKRSNAMVL